MLWITMLMLAAGVTAAEEPTPQSPPELAARRHAESLVLAFQPAAAAHGQEHSGPSLSLHGTAATNELSRAAVTARIDQVEAELLLMQLQADGFFRNARVAETNRVGESEGYAIVLGGYDGERPALVERVADDAEAVRRIRGLATVLGGRGRTRLCGSCGAKLFITSIGQCSLCGTMTRSGTFVFCKACATAKACCESCGKLLPLGAADALSWLADHIEAAADAGGDDGFRR